MFDIGLGELGNEGLSVKFHVSLVAKLACTTWSCNYG